MDQREKEKLKGIGAFSRLVRRPLRVAEKTRAVVLFAQFHRLSEVRAALAEEFGVDVDKSTLASYDAARPGSRCSAALKTLFAEARKAHLEDLSTVGVAHQVHRLRVLDKIVQASVSKGEHGTAMSALKQAAEEMGGVLTNVKQVDVRHLHLSVEDAKAELAMRLSNIVEEQALLPTPEASEDS